MAATELSPRDESKTIKATTLRIWAAVLAATLVSVYILGIVLGYVPKEHRLDASALTLIVVVLLAITVLLRPDVINRLRVLEALNFRVELSEVKEKLARQSDDLTVIRMMLPFLLGDKERIHLTNLARHQTANYKGGNPLRTELRRLRSIGLIRMRGPDCHIGQMTSDKTFDLADFVELTSLGEYWARRIDEIQKEDDTTEKLALTHSSSSQ
jgi:hypothetical protein